ncbi:LamG domain-containing protein [Dactylosporangium sp. CS-047395]|uniref:LamG domain-containing protein n=1 Tax=Dactylosporangium sp. CS-047395 TaxID=3239936 RepID=UPI003D944B6A
MRLLSWCVPLLAVLSLVVPAGVGAAFSDATTSANTLSAAASFGTYPATVTADAPYAYHRAEDAVSAAATSPAGDASGSSHLGTYTGGNAGASTWWPADENTGTTAGDASGAANQATLGSAATWATGRDGVHSALSFTGSAATSYAAGSQPAVRTSQAFTVMAWANPHTLSGNRAVLSQAGTTSSGFILKYDNTAAKWRMLLTRTDSTGPVSDSASSTTAPATDTWVHLAGVVTASGTIQLYVNGVLEGSYSGHTGVWDATGALQAGRSWWNGAWTDAFDGRVDDVRTYRRALSAAEIRAAYGTGETTHWSFAEGTGTTAADSAGGVTANAGTLGAGAGWTTGPAGSGTAVTLDGSANGSVTGTVPSARTDAPFTFAAWANPGSTAAGTVLSISGGTGFAAALRINAAGRWSFAATQGDSAAAAVDEATGSTAAAAAWTHLVGVYDGGSTLTLFVNGAQAGTATHTPRWNGTGALRAGPFTGGVDDVRVFGRALGSAEVAALYAGTPLDVGAGAPPDPITAGLPGALQGAQGGQTAATAIGLRGITNLYTNAPVTNPAAVTVEGWFRTRSGGALIGLQDAPTGPSAFRDRVLYLDSGGRLSFGAYNGGTVVVRSPAGPVYTDGAWHYAAASLGPAGMRLYVDGALVASAANTAAQSYTGWWRYGGCDLTGWPNRPLNDFLVGALDELAVYSSQLSDQQIAWHYHANH